MMSKKKIMALLLAYTAASSCTFAKKPQGKSNKETKKEVISRSQERIIGGVVIATLAISCLHFYISKNKERRLLEGSFISYVVSSDSLDLEDIDTIEGAKDFIKTKSRSYDAEWKGFRRGLENVYYNREDPEETDLEEE